MPADIQARIRRKEEGASPTRKKVKSAPVVDDETRLRVHQAWRHGQVVVGEVDSRLVLAVPGTRFGPDLVLDALGRLSRAVGARSERWGAMLRLG